MDNFIETHSIINPMQFGFQAKKKTDDALVYVTDRICEAIDNSKPCISIFLDLAKAFDSQPRVTLK